MGEDLDSEFRGHCPGRTRRARGNRAGPGATEVEIKRKRRLRREDGSALQEIGVSVDGLTARQQLEAMDREIDIMVLYPTRGLGATAIERMDGRLSSALCRAYKQVAGRFLLTAPERLWGSQWSPSTTRPGGTRGDVRGRRARSGDHDPSESICRKKSSRSCL